VRRVLGLLLSALVVAGCAHDADRPGDFAGMTRAEARTRSVRVARAMPNVEARTNEFASPMEATPIGTFVARNSVGGEAWLTVFRLFKHQTNDPDQACVWAWRDSAGHHFEDVPSVAWGHTDAMHERCVHVVLARGFASRDQTMGDARPPPAYPQPTPMTPFGSLVRGLYPTQILPYDALFLVGPSIEAPLGPAPGTCEFEGRVVDEAHARVVPYARLAVSPSRPWSGISDGGAWAWPAGAIVTTADRSGAFVVTNLPLAWGGYDISIRALGYAPSRSVHEPCGVVGEWEIGRRATFVDATPRPLARR